MEENQNGNIKKKKRRYAEYQLEWLRDHGYSLQDLVDIIIESAREGVQLCPNLEIGDAIQEGFDCLESVNGFNGELWACEDAWENREKLRYFMYANVRDVTDNDDTCENFIIAAHDKDEAHELF